MRQSTLWGKRAILFLFFNWRIIALQGCVNFCCTATWISHMYTYIPSLWSLLPGPHLIPLGHHRAPSWAPCDGQQIPTSFSTFLLLPVVVHICQSYSPLCPTLPLGGCAEDRETGKDKKQGALFRMHNTFIEVVIMPKVIYIAVAESAFTPNMSDFPLWEVTSWDRWSDQKVSVHGYHWSLFQIWPRQKVTLQPVLFWNFS